MGEQVEAELLRRDEAAALLTVSVATFEKLRRDRTHIVPLPVPLCVGPVKGHRWRRAELVQWIERRKLLAALER